MTTNQYDYLRGMVSVNADAPAGWEAEWYLPFWMSPNNDAWGKQLCRILYHETIHFWQLLSSGYLAALVATEWERLLHYEATGELKPADQFITDHPRSIGSDPFSTAELTESWARFWDVHTRNPARIINEEGIVPGDGVALTRQFGQRMVYTGEAFDTVMQVGEDCAVYGAPYRWLLETVHDSYLAGLLFPILAQAAFTTVRPAGMFITFAQQATAQASLIQNIFVHATRSINLDWLTIYPIVRTQLIDPVLKEILTAFQKTRTGGPGPVLHDGFFIIRASQLASHPILREYPLRYNVRGYLNVYEPTLDPDNPYSKEYNDALVDSASNEPDSVLMFPGQPFYRGMLGNLVPPPVIKFRNITWYARRPIQLVYKEAKEGQSHGDTYAEISTVLDRRVARYRAAQYAVSRGLPANAFES